MSLPQSALPFSSHLIIFQPTVHPFTGYTSPMHRLNHLYILHYHFALCTIHTHTRIHRHVRTHTHKHTHGRAYIHTTTQDQTHTHDTRTKIHTVFKHAIGYNNFTSTTATQLEKSVNAKNYDYQPREALYVKDRPRKILGIPCTPIFLDRSRAGVNAPSWVCGALRGSEDY